MVQTEYLSHRVDTSEQEPTELHGFGGETGFQSGDFFKVFIYPTVVDLFSVLCQFPPLQQSDP